MYADNDRAQRLYRGQGFVLEGTHCAYALRQTKGAETDKPDLLSPRDISTLRTSARRGTVLGEAFAFDLFELGSLSVAIGDDMRACLDAVRWATSALYPICLRASTCDSEKGIATVKFSEDLSPTG